MQSVTKINFVLPPSPLFAAGLKNAVDGLAQSLVNAGVTVSFGLEHDTSIDLHHFHGLWHREHSKFGSELSSRGVPFVISPHGMLEPWAIKNKWWKKRLYLTAIEKYHLKRATSLFAASKMEANSISNILVPKFCPIIPIGCMDPKGVNYEHTRGNLGWGRDELVLLFLSRLDKKKGLELLFETLNNLDMNRATRLVIVGDGEPKYVSELKRQSLTLNQPNLKIEWVGSVWGEDRWQYFQASDLFCLPTYSENFGIAVLEALYAGTPVLTTDQTPWKEHQDIEGLIISQPTPGSLKKGLQIALSQFSNWTLAERQTLSQWASDNYAWRNLAAEYLTTYNDVMRRHHAA